MICQQPPAYTVITSVFEKHLTKSVQQKLRCRTEAVTEEMFPEAAKQYTPVSHAAKRRKAVIKHSQCALHASVSRGIASMEVV